MEQKTSNIRNTIDLRHSLHREPELSGKEAGTAEKLKIFLQERKPDRLITGLGNHGLLAVYNGRKPGQTVLLRCEIDAVPVEEDLDVPYRSVKPGVAHKCGHDGHMAIMAGVAGELHLYPPDTGTVLLLFQPAEENGSGAAMVLGDAKFKGFQPDIVFALHNLPGFPMGSVITKTGPFSCASSGLIIKMKGKSSHAGEPLMGISPAPAVAELIQGFEHLCRHDEGVFITLIHCVIGEIAFGTSPENAVVMATLRAPTGELMDKLSSSSVALVKKTAEKFGLKLQILWTEEFPVTVNSKEADSIIRETAESLKLETIELAKPFPWSEDFGHFTGRFGGALFGLGAGADTPPLHNPSYDFPDQLAETGIAMYMRIIERTLNT